MPNDMNIKVHHLTRVEGHGDIVVEIRDGRLMEARFSIVEAPRLFEAFLRGLHYDEVTHIAPRICGICSVSHKSAALKATEAALGVEVSNQTELLRRVAFHGELIGSHILHVYFLAAPDFFGVPSVIPLAESQPEVVARAMRMIKLAYDLCEVIAGRHTHPVAMTVGGFRFIHSESKLRAMRRELEEGIADLKATVQLFKTISIPQFERETEFVSLHHPDHYALYDGDLCSSAGDAAEVARYREIIQEYVVPFSTAKHARWHDRHYMVGALARVNNNFDQLNPIAKEAAHDLGLKVPCWNPFMNTVAQIVECAHSIKESIDLIDTILERGIRAEDEQVTVSVGAGRAVGAVEAPRGLLFHEYEYDNDGTCLAANHVIPTAQNLANLEADLHKFVPLIVDGDKDSVTHQLEMLVRAYDPCISCSTHILKVNSG
ncbi:MAG: Ni/Fe hydrogenase subunit alpha [Deltaproteobacteria bacterium]